MPFILFIIFLILKLTHNIDWSWVYVTLPLWAGIALGIIFSIIGVGAVGLGAGIGAFFSLFKKGR